MVVNDLIHWLTGFDKTTELLVREYVIPDVDVPAARHLAGANPDPDVDPFEHEINPENVTVLALMMGEDIPHPERFDWFVGPTRG